MNHFMAVIIWMVFFGFLLQLPKEAKRCLSSFAAGQKFIEKWANKRDQIRSGFRLLWPSSEQRKFQGMIWVYQELQETLEAGIYPTDELWQSMGQFSYPWNRLSLDSLQALRSQGNSILPTLRRLRALVESLRRLEQDTRHKIAPALGQAILCILMVPGLGLSLYFLLDEIQSQWQIWILICFIAAVFSTAAALWMLKLADRARWGCLPPNRRPAFIAALVAGEWFCAKVRSGNPADLAYLESVRFLSGIDLELSKVWQNTVWNQTVSQTHPEKNLLSLLEGFGKTLKKAAQVSMIEGRPCLERVEVALDALRSDLLGVIDSEVLKLGNRALLPLFLGIAPSVLGLIFGAMALLTFQSVLGLE